jgi:RHS repeat-associated protein
MKKFLLLLLFASTGPRSLVGDDHNPIGVTGVFEGVSTTGGAYNVLNHNATRQIDDIVVPGAIGKYGLKMTRYYNSRRTNYGGPMGPEWTHEYMWTSSNGKIEYPNGNVWDGHCTDNWIVNGQPLNGPLGVSDWPTTSLDGHPAFRLSDGGMVVFGNASWPALASQIIDPYGRRTTLTYYTSAPLAGLLKKVTEPGGRYLQFNYSQQGTPQTGFRQMLTEVDAYDGQGHQIESVAYQYNPRDTGGHNVSAAMCLTQVNYGDGPPAKYTYIVDNQPENSDPPCPCMIKLLPLVRGCDDVRYHGPMCRVAYDYQNQGPHGAIRRERYWDGTPGTEGNGVMVSRVDPALVSPLVQNANFVTNFTEYRGDGPTRTFNYTALQLGRSSGEGETCPIWTQGVGGPAPQQFLTSYTDFQTNTTNVGYDANWYVNSVRDANLHTTTYLRGPRPPAGIGEILTITHPGGSHIDYVYVDHGHYVHSVSDERQNVTTYWRDPITHLVTQIDYPQDPDTPASSETFNYDNNNFGLVSTHRLKNGNYQHFAYGGRGLLLVKTNPTNIADWQTAINSAPATNYTYYTAADGNLGWIDRVKTVTLPANESNLRASETYEYDRALSGGVTNFGGAAVAGRGLVTKITHGDGTYQRFKYDAYGNKVWEDNERRQVTQYAYDDYNRLLSVTRPLNGITSYTYVPTNGGGGSSYKHTTNSADTITTRVNAGTNIVTSNVYDENFRKTSTTAASGTLNLITRFTYDPVGNLTDVTDPRNKVTHNVYDNRNRKTEMFEAYQTPVQAHTVWGYDRASNVDLTLRPDWVPETKRYDALNRMIRHTVPRQVAGPSPTPPPLILATHIYYNPSGTIDHVTDERNITTSFQYNASDEKITMTYPLLSGQQQSDTQSWVWDNAHNLASRTTVAGGNEIQRFHYNIRNWKTSMSWDNGADSANYTYFDDGRLCTASNANSTVTRAYDDAGRLTLDQQNVTGLGSSKSVNYEYNDDGTLKRIYASPAPNPSYDYTYSYDAAGRFQTISPTGGSVLFEYAYDASSNETHRYAYFGNVTIDQIYNRDSLNRIASRLLTKNGQSPAFSIEAYTYDHLNRIQEVGGGGSADFFGFYWDGELMSATYGGGPHFPFTEGQEPDLDAADNIDANAGYKTPDTENPEPTPPPDDYSDPPVGGLLPPDNPTGHSVGYYFDRAGNRQQVTDTANPTINYVQNNINQYKSASGCSITNGSEHEINSFEGLYDTQPVYYYYVNDERLKQVSSPDTRYFYYDALGRCVKRSPTVANGGNTTYYIYDGEKPILEYSSTGIVGRNVYGKGIDEILMRTNPGVNDGYPFYYAQDHEGSVTHLLDGRSSPAAQTGNVIEQYHYDAFGLPTFYDANTNQINSTAYNNRFLFTGREYAATYRGTYIPEFRFYEYRARAYHPDLGRFMSEDAKLFDAGDYNLFRYCHNDPIDFTDPMGLDDAAPKYSPRQASQEREENLSASQAVWQRQMHFDRANGAIATGFKAAKDFIIATDKMTGGRQYRALVRDYFKWTKSNRAATPRWLQAFLGFVDDTGGVGLGVPIGGLSGGPVIIGETMTRVQTAADSHPGAVILDNMPDFKAQGMNAHQVTSAMMQFDRKWTFDQLRSGRQWIDIGRDPNRVVPSIFYPMEATMRQNYLKLHPELSFSSTP